MDSTDHRSFAALNDDELDGLVDVVIEQFGSTLDRAQYDHHDEANRYVTALWRRYRSKTC
jgi:hypothetical protein